MIDTPVTVIPRSLAACPDCDATPAGCRGVRALRGRYCCPDCDLRGGDHDLPRGVGHADTEGGPRVRSLVVQGPELFSGPEDAA